MTATEMKAEFARQLKLFLPEISRGEEQYVVEVRAMQVPHYYETANPIKCVAGFFDIANKDGRNALFNAITGYVACKPESRPESVYLTPNPIDPVFLARCNNAMSKKRDRISCEDKHVTRRVWVMLDVDPVRPLAGISATEEEKAAAREVFDAVLVDLAGRGFPKPMLIDSGNGFHAYYRVALPTDDGNAVHDFLKALAKRHDTAAAHVDTTVCNPSRVMKIPGSWAGKGSDVQGRPHRVCRVIEIPTEE